MNDTRSDRNDTATIEMPAPTVWPMALALGLMLAASGVVTNWVFSIVGVVLVGVAIGGWIHALVPEAELEEVALVPVEQRPRPIQPSATPVEPSPAALPDERVRLPMRVHPYTAGIAGGILGGVAMAAVAETYGILSGHGIWYPINLLSGMLLPGTAAMSVAQLEQFSLVALVLGTLIHATASVAAGLLFALILPALPGRPVVWGGIVAPLFWTGGIYAFMGVLNPAMNQRLDWGWFVGSQFAYGLVVGFVVGRSKQIATSTTGGRGDATAAVLVAAALLSLPGCGVAQPDEPPSPAAKAFDFDAVFGKHCSGCHGAKGEYGPAPPLNDPLLVTVMPADQMIATVTTGRSAHLMPAFGEEHGGPLTSGQIAKLVSELRSRWGPPPGQADTGAPSYLSDQPKSDRAKDVEAGKELFASICAHCHGKDGEGSRLAGPLHSQAFLGIVSDQLLRRIVITGRPDLGMPDYRDLGGMRPPFRPLTSAEISQIVAFLISWRESSVPPDTQPQNAGDAS